MDKREMIDNLLAIRASIQSGAGGGVTDTAWMIGRMSETVVERIESMLIDLGVPFEEIDERQAKLFDLE